MQHIVNEMTRRRDHDGGRLENVFTVNMGSFARQALIAEVNAQRKDEEEPIERADVIYTDWGFAYVVERPDFSPKAWSITRGAPDGASGDNGSAGAGQVAAAGGVSEVN
jgi:hypothetical protein